MNNKRAYKLNFNWFGDKHGGLVAIEGNKDIPFNIARVFYIFDTGAEVIRGQHANRKSEFVLINIRGESKIRLDYGDFYEIIELNEPHAGVYIPKMIWKDMYDFTEDSVLLALSDNKYDPEEYIRNYEEYVSLVSHRGGGNTNED